MRLVVVPALLFFLVPCEDAAQPYQRGAKFLRPTRTSTVVETSTVTAWVASSCVKMPSTLAPCRSARFLYFSQSAQQENQTIEQLPGAKAETVGWAEYFDIFPTVTVTATQLVTTTVTDPEVVATYVVNNCVPKFLPSSLPRFVKNDVWEL
ncbi:hypothetical protein NQ315_001268 [Exocentrus adspersus]|uniref:Secreted protein n=1 Tax=Exocentrus adspersus TaxID=1586481 RepID=A0AAV8WF69_9CUCU|nr:hypothetical protein NQ315_001268 [Exocentrus adspersus]